MKGLCHADFVVQRVNAIRHNYSRENP